MPALVDQVQALCGSVEDDAEVRADRVDELLRLADEAAQVRSRPDVPARRERVRRDHLDAERAEHEREHERCRRVAVVDDDPEVALADRVLVERLEQLLGVDLAGPHGIVDVADAVACRTAELAAVEVLLDLLLELAS